MTVVLVKNKTKKNLTHCIDNQWDAQGGAFCNSHNVFYLVLTSSEPCQQGIDIFVLVSTPPPIWSEDVLKTSTELLCADKYLRLLLVLFPASLQLFCLGKNLDCFTIVVKIEINLVNKSLNIFTLFTKRSQFLLVPVLLARFLRSNLMPGSDYKLNGNLAAISWRPGRNLSNIATRQQQKSGAHVGHAIGNTAGPGDHQQGAA